MVRLQGLTPRMTVGEWQQNHTLVAALQAMTAAAVPAAVVTHLLPLLLLPL